MIREYTEDRRNFMDLLLLADEQEDIIEAGVQLVDMIYLRRQIGGR